MGLENISNVAIEDLFQKQVKPSDARTEVPFSENTGRSNEMVVGVTGFVLFLGTLYLLKRGADSYINYGRKENDEKRN